MDLDNTFFQQFGATSISQAEGKVGRGFFIIFHEEFYGIFVPKAIHKPPPVQKLLLLTQQQAKDMFYRKRRDIGHRGGFNMHSQIVNIDFLYNRREQKQPNRLPKIGEKCRPRVESGGFSPSPAGLPAAGSKIAETTVDPRLICVFDFRLFINNIQKNKKNMQYSPFTSNLLELTTLPTIHSNYLPTLTFVYPTQNLSSLIDFHYNCNPPLQHLPFLYHSEALPSTETTIKNLPTPVTFKSKAKKPRNRDQRKELESAKKNSESNLVNQLYSYFSNYEKSQKVVERAILGLKKNINEIQKIKSVFYNTVRLINFKRGRKYVNKDSVLAYYSPENCRANIEGIVEQLNNLNIFSIEEFCHVFRVCTSHFFREISLNAVLTSKRISSVARNEHLKRRRKVVVALRGSESN